MSDKQGALRSFVCEPSVLMPPSLHLCIGKLSLEEEEEVEEEEGVVRYHLCLLFHGRPAGCGEQRYLKDCPAGALVQDRGGVRLFDSHAARHWV